MNPRTLKVYLSGYRMKREQQRDYDNYMAYLTGAYVREAIASTVGNMFAKKTAKPFEYPKEPYSLEGKRELTEAEKELQRIQFLDSLMQMQANFERTHNKDNVV